MVSLWVVLYSLRLPAYLTNCCFIYVHPWMQAVPLFRKHSRPLRDQSEERVEARSALSLPLPSSPTPSFSPNPTPTTFPSPSPSPSPSSSPPPPSLRPSLRSLGLHRLSRTHRQLVRNNLYTRDLAHQRNPRPRMQARRHEGACLPQALGLCCQKVRPACRRSEEGRPENIERSGAGWRIVFVFDFNVTLEGSRAWGEGGW
jgi:hypothetical protein